MVDPRADDVDAYAAFARAKEMRITHVIDTHVHADHLSGGAELASRVGAQYRLMGDWTPEGHIGQMFKVIGKHVPPPPHFPSPLLWGDEATCRQRLGAGVKDVQIARYMYPFEYPFSPAKVVDFFIEYYGPTNRAYASLNDEGRKGMLLMSMNLLEAAGRW